MHCTMLGAVYRNQDHIRTQINVQGWMRFLGIISDESHMPLSKEVKYNFLEYS